jgi:lipopolysaccharide/colanic/teichoic acid biosynthesis glycosyltransferase
MFALLFLPGLPIPQKLTLHALVLARRAQEAGAERVVVYGAGSAARRIVSTLLQSHRLRILPIAMIEESSRLQWDSVVEMAYRRGVSVPVLCGPLTPGLLQSFRCNLLIVVTRNLSAEQIALVEEVVGRAGVRIAYLSGAELERPLSAEKVDLDGLSLASATELSTGLLSSFLKRCVDLIGSAMLLFLFAPLFALIALLIRLDSPGPALFVHERVGRRGRIFSMYKFRSMVSEASRYERSPLTSCDPRLTRIGRVLRRTSLDELPQLVNVFRGDMSLVGPRPEMPFVVRNYTAGQRRRLQVAPGLTGLWQLSADRAFPIHEALEYDLYYIRTRGFFLDLAILTHTLFFAMRGGV